MPGAPMRGSDNECCGTMTSGLAFARTMTLPHDAVAQEAELDRRFRAPLMSFFRRRLRDPEAAADLTQDVFERLLRARQRGEVKDVEALVFVTASNLLKDLGRKTQHRDRAQDYDFDGALVSAVSRELLEDRSPERIIQARDSVAAALQALNELGTRTRDVYVLFRLEGLKQAEIAALYGISRSTVEKDIMRATAHLTLRFGSRE